MLREHGVLEDVGDVNVQAPEWLGNGVRRFHRAVPVTRFYSCVGAQVRRDVQSSSK
jgi:hypothetical protein